MKHKKYVLSAILLVFVFTFMGCSKEKDPKESFNSFASFLANKDYSAMYKLLGSETKKSVDEKYFVESYSKAYGSAKVGKVTVNPKYPEKLKADKEGKIEFPVEISLETPIGNIQFTYNAALIKEKQEKEEFWTVAWDEKMILPGFEKGDLISYAKKLGKRGEIRDRNGLALAVNGEAVTVYVIPQKIEKDRANTIAYLAEVLGTTAQEIEGKLSAPYVKSHPDQRVPIMTLARATDIDKAKKAIVPIGVEAPVEPITIRVYPLKEAAAHLIGYIDNITEEELNKYSSQGYDAYDVLGKTGLESIYEKRLRGEMGGSIAIVNNSTKKKQILIEKAAKDGENITLSIDANLQSNIYAQLAGDKGAAVATNPKTGEVLAMVSSPSYNPNTLISELNNKYYLTLESSQDKPLISRFASAVVPGSTFKPITAAIGLDSGKLDPNKELAISGKQWQKDSSWGDYFVTRVHEEDTSVNLKDAFVTSDNIYFANSALSVGKDGFIKGTKAFGLDEKMEFPFPMATSQIGNIDTDIMLADSGYGQGQILINPLQLSLIYNSFVNEGNVLSPVLEMKDLQASPKVWKASAVSKEAAAMITQDLIQVVEDASGTGKDAKIAGLTLAGKTGTAELKTKQDTQGKENGWFSTFNTQDPKLSVIMMIEEVQGKGGSKYVVPKVRKVFEHFFKK
jgi:penicillin-binding protein